MLYFLLFKDNTKTLTDTQIDKLWEILQKTSKQSSSKFTIKHTFDKQMPI
jgi:ABC-type uncharacterized transport system ATPase subunit